MESNRQPVAKRSPEAKLMGAIITQVRASKAKMSARLSKTTEPLNYETTLRIIRDAALAVRPAPVLVAEGANTMDNAR